MITKKAFKRHLAVGKTYEIIYCISPDFVDELKVTKTGTYAYVRSCALTMAASGHCVILDIKEKNNEEF